MKTITPTAYAMTLVVPLVAASLLPAALRAQSHALVDVGGHGLDVVQVGGGSPAVVFETGLADSLDAWAPIWPAIGQYTTAIAYSRAGLGRSESGPSNHSARAEVEELHALLHHLSAHPPYVLVGRSYGGLLVRLYISLYPADVVGVVIVDGTHEQQVERYGILDRAYPAQFRAFFDSVLAGLPSGTAADEIRETMRIQAAGTVAGLTPLPDIPIAVLTSMRVDPTSRYVNATARGHEVWRALHDEWFHRSTNGIHIETARSGHAIQSDEPALVIDAIRFVLDQARAR
jgi:pimeloyl-ACP methyl ester carboxylesterase